MQAKKQTRPNPYCDMAHEGARHYERARHLPALLALWPHEINDFSRTGTKGILGKLQEALSAERRRGRSGHWCYDLNRHLSLVSALEGERAHLASLKG